MKKEEADRLRDIADVLDDKYNDFPKDCTNNESYWFYWAAEEIRKVIMDSGFNAITDDKYDRTHTTWKPNKEDE